MPQIQQKHRDQAAASIPDHGSPEKAKRIRDLIRAGDFDHHPAVQAEAFYNP